MSWRTEVFATRVCELNLDEVKGKARPRFGGGRTYRLPADEAHERRIREAWLASCGPALKGWDDEVHLRIDYQRPYPKSGARYREGDADLCKPDIDNVLKLVMDALNGAAWKDDCCVTDVRIRKHRRFTRRQAYMRIEVAYVSNTAAGEPRGRKGA